MNVSIIGAGNLAWHLAPAFDNTDFAVKEVYSRNIKHANALVEKLYEATTKVSLDFSISPSKVFILAVSDDAIPEVVREIILPENSYLIHTSGSQPLSVLGYAPTDNIGVLYPLQTFSKNRKLDLKEVPIFIEGENAETEKVLLSLARAVSKKVYKIRSSERKALHVAAVFASNFTNHMLTVSKQIVTENNLDFDVLKPLIAETINKALTSGPENSQTGPAKRADLEILDKHIEFLQNDPDLAELYRTISQHIIDWYNQE